MLSPQPLQLAAAFGYGWIESVLRRFDYRQLPRPQRGPVLAYLQRLSGYSRAR